VVEVDGGKLLAAGPIQPPLELKPVGPSSFYVAALSADLEFTRIENGGMKVKITQPAGVTEGTRAANGGAKEADLSSYKRRVLER